MERIAVGLEYDGTAYAGWQSQHGLPSVQAALERALSAVADEPISVTCAGRTDARVHARAQVAHFDTTAARTARGWILGANTHLPSDISLAWMRRMPAHFHARYSAEARTYLYVVLNRLARSALVSHRALCVHRPLDVAPMREAAAQLVGEHDFSAFRSSECQARSPVRRLESLEVRRDGEWVLIEATANAFVHHMMRNIVGLLLAVGLGKASPGTAQSILLGRDRREAPATAAAHGLYLRGVRYPAAFGVPQALPDDGATRSAMIAP